AELSLFLENIENNLLIWHESVIDPAQNDSILEYNLNKLVTEKCYPLVEHENNLMIWYKDVINSIQNSKLVMESFFVENSTEYNHLVEQDNSLMIEYESAQNGNTIGNDRIYTKEQVDSQSSDIEYSQESIGLENAAYISVGNIFFRGK
ncbi:998_t:CDS:2, partial [Racocetra persica]